MPSITFSRAGDLAIGELSRATGVNIETIRYYERIGMLAPPPRSAAGRRCYAPGDARVLAFIRRARQLGFALEEIRALLKLNRSHGASCCEVQKIASLHLESVRAKIADLVALWGASRLAETFGCGN